MAYSECHETLARAGWRASLTESAIGLASQLSAHAICLFAAFTNVVVGGVSFAIGHDFLSTLLLGTAMYLVSIGVRRIWNRDARRPNLAIGVLGLAVGVVAASGIDAARTQNHRVEMSEWFAGLPGGDRQAVRDKIRVWIEKQGASQQETLSFTAALIGYRHPEDYVVLNYCTSADKDLAKIWKEVGAPIDGKF